MSTDAAAPGAVVAKRGATLKLFYTQVHERNLGLVKLLINTVLPVKYSEDFYRKVLASSSDWTKMGQFIDALHGGDVMHWTPCVTASSLQNICPLSAILLAFSLL